MDCNELVEVVTAYIEGTLSPRDRERFDAHLQDCPDCAAYVEQMRATIAALGTIPVESIDEASRKRLLSTFRDFTKPSDGRRR